jgi:hypothetical protein
MESVQLSCYWQIPKWYQNEQQLFYDKDPKSAWTSDLSSRKGGTSETTCGSYRQLLSSHKSGFDILARRARHAPHTTPILFTWFSLQRLLFVFYSERKLEMIQVRQEDQLSEHLQEISRDINHDKFNRAFRAWVQQVHEVNQGIRDYLR